MALKKELGFLFKALLDRSALLPTRVKGRTIQDINDMFADFEALEDAKQLEALKVEAENKLNLLELSTSSFKPPPVDTPGSKKYVMKDGQLQEGSEDPKLTMDYSNWYAGNVDPQELRRHKELLDRQHYSGPFWENRPRNASILDIENPEFPYVEPEPHPPESLRQEKEVDAWETVKR